MLELATKFLKANRPEHRTEGKPEHTFPDIIYTQIETKIKELAPKSKDEKKHNGSPTLQQILWELRDERAAEILADVFYAKPGIAKRLCEIKPDLCPGYIRYLVDEAYREWLIETARRDWPAKQDIHNL